MKHVPVALLVLVALASIAVRFVFIANALPYLHHGDETRWATHSLTILQTGDLNPHRFTKPGAHVYFMTSGFALGFLRAAANLEVDSLEEMGSEACRIYAVPAAAQVAKEMYAVVSVLAMVLAGVLARRLSGIPTTLFLAPLFVTISASYLGYSWSYMNTNVLGAFAILATISYPLCAREGVSSQKKAVLVGALCGLTVACKYNLFLILVPGCLYFVLYHRDRWLSHCLGVLGVALLTFFLITPYALLDLPTFLQDLGGEAHHYARGHHDLTSATFEPGTTMFMKYFSVLLRSFGGLVLILALVGVVRLFVLDWRASSVAFLFPILFVPYMSQQATFFARNILSLHLFVGIGAAVGLCFGVEAVLRRLSARAWVVRRPRLARATVAAVAVGLVLAALPWRVVRAAYELRVDPRNQAVEWVLENAKPWYVILVERRLAVATDTLLEAGFDVVVFKAAPADDTVARLRDRFGSTLILYPEYSLPEFRNLFSDVKVVADFPGVPTDVENRACGGTPPRVKIGRL